MSLFSHVLADVEALLEFVFSFLGLFPCVIEGEILPVIDHRAKPFEGDAKGGLGRIFVVEFQHN